MRRDELRSAIELPARHAGLRGRARPDARADRRRRGRAGGPAAALHLPARAVAATRRKAPAAGRLSRSRAACTRRWPAWPSARTGDWTATASGWRAASCCGSPGRARARPSCAPACPLEEFGDEARPVLDELTDSRLLTVSEGEVEVAHEALLREWPRLRGWLEDDAEGRRLHRNLRTAASEWDAGGRDRGELYRGARLAAARDWAADHDPELDRPRAGLPRRERGRERARPPPPADGPGGRRRAPRRGGDRGRDRAQRARQRARRGRGRGRRSGSARRR